MRFTIPIAWAAFVSAAAAQPDPAALRRLFEQGLARRLREFGDADARTAQAARDLALFLERAGDTAAARRAFQQAIRVDEKAMGLDAAQTLQDVGALAAISPPAAAAPLLLRASNSPDPTVAGPALSSLAAIRKAAGPTAPSMPAVPRVLPARLRR